MTKEEKKEELWQELFALQKEACKGPLCFPDKCRFNDLSLQLKEFYKEEKKG